MRLVLADPDGHGLSTLIIALYREPGSFYPYSNFSTTSKIDRSDRYYIYWRLTEPPAEPENIELTVLDVPLDRTFLRLLSKYRKVLWIDHHSDKNYSGSNIIHVVARSSYEMSLKVMNLFKTRSSFTLEWALAGAVLDFDSTITEKVSDDLEYLYCHDLDIVIKYGTALLEEKLKIDRRDVEKHGIYGSLALKIVEKELTPSEVASYREMISRSLGRKYRIINRDVVVSLEPSCCHAWWKEAWYLSYLTKRPIALVWGTYMGYIRLIVSIYWRYRDELYSKVRLAIKQLFNNRIIREKRGGWEIELDKINIDVLEKAGERISSLIRHS
ncbi:MAG: hypothetical protein GXO26_01740 [Crenarchaeota archaeon]|nr:hypothetical protein [Thermoproteota archaeon]